MHSHHLWISTGLRPFPVAVRRSSDDVSDSGSDSGGEGSKKKKKKGKADKGGRKKSDKPGTRKTISAGGSSGDGSARSGPRLQDRQFKDALNMVRTLGCLAHAII